MAKPNGICCQNLYYTFLCCIICLFTNSIDQSGTHASIPVKDENTKLLPTVVIATLVRNKAHTLPWFLGLVEKLDYPKNRIALWIASDHNADNTTAMLREWLSVMSQHYHHVEANLDDEMHEPEQVTPKHYYDDPDFYMEYEDEVSPCDWTVSRFANVIQLREQALDFSRDMWADYLFLVDADVTLENNRTLQILMGQKKLVIGPMLNSSLEGYYSNFWGGMSEKGYYVRSDNYISIVDRELVGVFPVPMVHTAVLIDLHHYLSPFLSYSTPPPGYSGPRDDIIMFAHSVKAVGETMYVINTEYFGKVMIPLDKRHTLMEEKDQFDHVKLEAMVQEVPPLYSSPHIYVPEKPKDKLGFDEVYMVNLKRRPARRFRMQTAFDYLGIEAKIVDAVDGKELNSTYLDGLGVEMLPGFADPYHGRSLTMGEIGCFLSHYHIWEEVVAKNYKKILIFEDDVRFEPYFRTKLYKLMEEVEEKFDAWDLIYLGRKRLRKDLEAMVEGSSQLAWPHYSYWTISYILSNSGAKKLLGQRPLSKMVPVDEYLPIMFDRHPEDTWKEHFFPRNLIGLSAEPFLLYPTHYTGEPYYISDTEDSVIIDKGQVENEVETNLSGDAKMARPEADGKRINDASVLEGQAGKDEL